MPPTQQTQECFSNPVFFPRAVLADRQESVPYPGCLEMQPGISIHALMQNAGQSVGNSLFRTCIPPGYKVQYGNSLYDF